MVKLYIMFDWIVDYPWDLFFYFQFLVFQEMSIYTSMEFLHHTQYLQENISLYQIVVNSSLNWHCFLEHPSLFATSGNINASKNSSESCCNPRPTRCRAMNKNTPCPSSQGRVWLRHQHSLSKKNRVFKSWDEIWNTTYVIPMFFNIPIVIVTPELFSSLT
jgi:hypothetical protein